MTKREIKKERARLQQLIKENEEITREVRVQWEIDVAIQSSPAVLIRTNRLEKMMADMRETEKKKAKERAKSERAEKGSDPR